MSEIHFSKLNNPELNQKIKNLAAQERHLTGIILEHVAEVDRRKLFLEMAYPSLFEYLTKEIGYSAGSAQRRIDGARLLQRIPEILVEVESGAIQLGQISKLQKICRQVKKESRISVETAVQKEVLDKIKNKNNEQTDLILAQEFQIKIATEDKSRLQRDQSVRLELTFSKEEIALIKKAQDLLSHKTGGGIKATIIEMAQKIIKASKPKARSAAAVNGFAAATASATVAVTSELKSLTPKVTKAVLARDQYCRFKDQKTGRVCGSKRFLEIDHVHPRFAGGDHGAENLQVLCKNHNLHRYRMGSPLLIDGQL